MSYTPGKLLAFAKAQMVARVTGAGDALAEIMIAKVSIPGPPRSKGGQPPRIDTLRKSGPHLFESIFSAVTVRDTEVFAQIGTNVKHGAYLDKGTDRMVARPWCLSTLKENRDLVRAALGVRG